MKVAICYYSKTGNTRKLATAISKTVGVPAETVSHPIEEPVDVLFLGSSVYAAGIDQEVKRFIASLDKSMVSRVVCFSTAALLPSTYKQVKQLLEGKGIIVDEREFHCRGSFKLLHRDRPNEQDLKDVQSFASNIIGE
ncbi:MAG: flavodoxin family protein [bacterium]|nr:flavodoxin family protein [bacterium]